MKITSGPFKGKRIEFADTSRVEATRQIAGEFMFEVFELEAGEYLITDESSVTDFCDFDTTNTPALWKLVGDRFGISATDVASQKLVDIFEAILARRNTH